MSSNPLATILRAPEIRSVREALSGTVRRAVAAGRYYEWGGGLGDVISGATQSEVFAQLDAGDPEPIVAVTISHNSCAWELLAFHPSARGTLTVLDLPYRDAEGPDFRWRNALPIGKPSPRTWLYPDGVLQFHAPAADRAVLASLPFRRAVLATTASLGCADSRTIPPVIVESVCGVLRDAGLAPVLVGRTYAISGSESVFHVDVAAPRVAGLVDLTDRLTVPGVLELVRTSPLVVACDSAVAVGAHALMRPTFSLVGDAYWRGCGGDPSGHGRILDDRFYQSTYTAYTDELLRQFIARRV